MNLKRFCLILVIYISSLVSANSIAPEIFVQSTINKATTILSSSSSKEKKIDQLKNVAKETVDKIGRASCRERV